MLSRSAVLKATVFPEFWTNWAIRAALILRLALTPQPGFTLSQFRSGPRPQAAPTPLQVDYSDLWDVTRLLPRRRSWPARARDLAERIAVAGAEWARTCFRPEDIGAYVCAACTSRAELLRPSSLQRRAGPSLTSPSLLLEYARLWSPDRADYSEPDSKPVWRVE